MPSLKKIVGYGRSVAYSASNLASSFGQSFFALQGVNNFIFQNQTSGGSIATTVTGLAAGFVKNLITVVPAIHHKFGPNNNINTAEAESPHLSWFPNLIHHVFKLSASISGTVTGLNAHLGVVVISNLINSVVNSDESQDDMALWKLLVVEVCATYVAYCVVKKYQAYDYKFLNKNSARIAQGLEDRDYYLNKAALAKTFSFTAFNLIAAPMLADYFGGPAFRAIPLFEKIVTDIGVDVCTKIASGSAFISSLATLPNVYDYFAANAVASFPDTALSKGLKLTAVVSGGIDSACVGMVNVVAVTSMAVAKLGVDKYGYINVLSGLCGLSAACQNALFNVRPGYIELVNRIYQQELSIDDIETQDLLSDDYDTDEEDDTYALSSLSENKNDIYKNSSKVGLLFQQKSANDSFVEDRKNTKRWCCP